MFSEIHKLPRDLRVMFSMFGSLVLGIVLANSALCDDTVFNEQHANTENVPQPLLRSPYVFTNKVEIQENELNNKTVPGCRNTAILQQILDILIKSLIPFGNNQLEPETIKYVLQVVKKYLEQPTFSTEQVELQNKYHYLEDLFNIDNKPTSRSLQYPLTNISPNDLKSKIAIQIELPNPKCHNIHENLVKFIISAHNQITNYCDTTGLCKSNILKWDAADDVNNLLYGTQKPLESDFSKLVVYLQHLPATPKLLNNDNAPNDANVGFSKNNVNVIGNNDIISLLQNYRPQEPTSDNRNVQNNQITKSLLEQLFPNQTPGQVYVTYPNEQQNQVSNTVPAYSNIAVNSNVPNTKSLVEKQLPIQTESKINFPYLNEQQNHGLKEPPNSGITQDSNLQNNQVLNLLIERLLLNKTPGQAIPNEQHNQSSDTQPSSYNDANNQIHNNQILKLLLQKLISNKSPSQFDSAYLTKQQNQGNKPTDNSKNVRENELDINAQGYQVPDSYLLGPAQLNITYTISNGKIVPVQNDHKNINNNNDSSSSSTLVERFSGNNLYDLKNIYANIKPHITNPSNANPTNTLYPNVPVNYGALPELSNSPQPNAQFVDSLNLQGNLKPAKFPFNSVKNMQYLQYPYFGFLPNYYYLNTKQDINNPNQKSISNQYQNGHSSIIGLNQVSRPEYITPNLFPYVKNAYVNPYAVSSSLTDNNVQGNNGLNLPDSHRLTSAANVVKLNSASDNSNKLVEITYVLQRPQQVLYEPVYYIKYRIPYYQFKYNLQNILSAKPYLQNNPNLLYQELLAQTNLTDSLPDLQGRANNNVIKLAGTNGTLIDAKLVQANETAIGEQLKIIQELNSKLDPKDVVNLNIAAVNQLKHLRLSQQNNSEVDNVERNYTVTAHIANSTIAVEPITNTPSVNQVNLSSYSSQLMNKQPLLNKPLMYPGQQTIRYKLPIMKQELPYMPLAYSQSPLIYKQNIMYGK